MYQSSVSVHLDQFDGPLGLLLHLIKRDDLSLRDLDINQLTNRYLSYLDQMDALNFDEAGDYLLMAATLLFLKSKDSVSEEDIDQISELIDVDSQLRFKSKADLIERLEDLERYQILAKALGQLTQRDRDVFCRPRVKRKELQKSVFTPLELSELTRSMVDYLYKQSRKFKVVKRDRLSIKEKLRALRILFVPGQTKGLEDLLDTSIEENTRDDKVITFISLLELTRLQKCDIFQTGPLGPIYVNIKASIEDLDVDQANGFDEETGS